jgi:hypothetical protein
VKKAGLNIGLRLAQRAIVSARPSEWFRTIGAMVSRKMPGSGGRVPVLSRTARVNSRMACCPRVWLKSLHIIPPITANDPSAHFVMAVLDTAIHAFAFESRSRRESQPTLLGISGTIRILCDELTALFVSAPIAGRIKVKTRDFR